MSDARVSRNRDGMTLEEEDAGARRRPSTIIDVATEAGVAIGTVSRYINGLPVRAGNRDLIENAIRQLGYKRNALAAAMKSDLTNMVGFMVPFLSEFHSAILEQLSRRLRKAGRGLLTYLHSDDRESIAEALEFFAAHRVDCLVMDGHEEAREGIRELVAGGTQVIIYDNDLPGLPVDRVLVENRVASARAVKHLLEVGHKRIGVLTGNLRNHTARERLEGYLESMRTAGADVVPEYIADGAWTESRGYAAMQRLLSLDSPPTAVFSCNYNMAVGALTMLKERGLRIPDDISLVSFDDVALFRLYDVGITAVAQPVESIADSISELLSAHLSQEGAARAPHDITLGCDIILRGSTRSLAQHGR